MDCAVKFFLDEDIYNEYLTTPEKVRETSMKVDIVKQVESIIRTWKTKIIKVITESQQLRRESDRVGPTLELEYWRRQLSKFMSIIEHIRRPETKMYIQLMIQARSKIVKVGYLNALLRNIDILLAYYP